MKFEKVLESVIFGATIAPFIKNKQFKTQPKVEKTSLKQLTKQLTSKEKELKNAVNAKIKKNILTSIRVLKAKIKNQETE